MEHISVSQVIGFRTKNYVAGNLMIPKFMFTFQESIPGYDEVIKLNTEPVVQFTSTSLVNDGSGTWRIQTKESGRDAIFSRNHTRVFQTRDNLWVRCPSNIEISMQFN